ncbi:MAG: hypothetical protein IRZ16_02315 [Myxococcaceae bacterium]|nr:hypothetical protein [Myxococcaceae bacterium]
MQRLFMRGAVLAAMVFASGCGLRNGFIRDSVTAQEFRFNLNVRSVQHLRTVEGTATLGLLFCAIPLEERLYARAMEDLYQNAKLKENEVLVNLREDTGQTFYLGLFCQQRLTVSADVVRITTDAAPAEPSPAPLPAVP